MRSYRYFVPLLLLICSLALSACGASKPQHSICVKGISGDKELNYEVAISADAVQVWYADGSKSYITQTSLPTALDDVTSAEKGLKLVDINFDGFSDIMFPFGTRDGNIFNYVLLNDGANSFSVCECFSDIPNLSVEGGNIFGETDAGIFGVRKSVYSLSENLSLLDYGTFVVDPFGVIRNMVRQLYGLSGVRIERPETNEALGIRFGRININGVYCSVYTVSDDSELVAVFAVSDDGHWFVDEGGTGFFVSMLDDAGSISLDSSALPVIGR